MTTATQAAQAPQRDAISPWLLVVLALLNAVALACNSAVISGKAGR